MSIDVHALAREMALALAEEMRAHARDADTQCNCVDCGYWADECRHTKAHALRRAALAKARAAGLLPDGAP